MLRNQTFQFILFLTCLSLLANCGNSSDKNTGVKVLKALSQNEIDAIWQRDCLPSSLGGSRRVTMEFSKAHFTETSTNYSDSNCVELSSAKEVTGTFVLSPSTGTLPAAKNLDMSTLEGAYAVYDQRELDKARGLKICGYSDWVMGEKHSCPETQKTVYQVYMFVEQVLTLGVLNLSKDGSTPEKRPESFSNQVFYKK